MQLNIIQLLSAYFTSVKRSKSESDLASLRCECTCRLNDSDNQATEECLELMKEAVLSLDDGEGHNEDYYDSQQDDYGPDKKRTTTGHKPSSTLATLSALCSLFCVVYVF